MAAAVLALEVSRWDSLVISAGSGLWAWVLAGGWLLLVGSGGGNKRVARLWDVGPPLQCWAPPQAAVQRGDKGGE